MGGTHSGRRASLDAEDATLAILQNSAVNTCPEMLRLRAASRYPKKKDVMDLYGRVGVGTKVIVI